MKLSKNLFIMGTMMVALGISTIADADTFQFGGESQDGDTVYLRDRYYDPATGTFLTKDPLGVAASTNQYQYCQNNPVNGTDSTGQFIWILAGAAIGGLVNGLVAWHKGESAGDIAKAVGVGAVTGALVSSGGALLYGAFEAGSIGVSGYVAANGLIGATAAGTNSTATQALTGDGTINVQSVASSVAIGAGFGVLGGASSSYFYNLAEVNNGNLADAQSSFNSMQSLINGIAEVNGGPLAMQTAANNPIIFSLQSNLNDLTLNTQNVNGLLNITEHTLNEVASPITEGVTDDVSEELMEQGQEQTQSTSLTPVTGSLDLPTLDDLSGDSYGVGGVLINSAAQLVGTNLSTIQGATYDPTTKQIIFLGANNAPTSTLSAINMDYYYTAIQAVYGSATPPYVTLDPPASPDTQWPFSQTFTNNSSQGFVMLYNPLWAGQDTTVAVRFRMTNQSGTLYDFTYNFNCVELDGYNGLTVSAGGRYAMGLVYSGTTGTPPSGLTLNTGPFQSGFPQSMTLTSSSQTSYWPIQLTNNTGGNLVVSTVSVIPARQHREYGGRVDGTKLGWVMYEADRVMKCLAVGKDNLTGVGYSSTSGNVNVTGYKNLEELAQSLGDQGGYNRMWFEPDDMTLQRYVDPTSGQATIGFQSSTVQLLTEAYLDGVPADPAANAFATFFTQNYSAFAAQSFPVEDPVNPATIDNVPIFAMLQQAMQAVCLARFFHDNNIPLDNWWMSSYTPPTANSPLSIPTAYNEAPSGSPWYLLYGGVRIHKPNQYVPSANAQTLGSSVLAARPAPTSSSAQDVPGQVWGATGTSQGNVTAVSASLAQDYQDGNLSLAESDLYYASPGELPLKFTRYYQSSWTGMTNLGPGWRDLRYALQFSAPSWNDQYHLLSDASGHALATASNGDTYLRSGSVRLLDLANGHYLDFSSSLSLTYGLNAEGNPSDTIAGLNAHDLPTFSSGLRASGATLVQNNDGSFNYTANLADGSSLLFDPIGNLLQTIDRHGHKHVYAYSSGQLSTITDDAGQALTLTYNATTGLLSQVTGPDGEGATYKYDTSNRLSGVVNTATNVALFQFAYNMSSQLVSVSTSSGTTALATTADVKGRSATRTNATGITTSYIYVKNADGSRTTSATLVGSGLSPAQKISDSMGRTTSVTDALGNTTGYSYGGSSLLPNSIQLPVANRPAIQVTRNSFGQPTTIYDPAMAGATPTTVSYDPTTSLPTGMTDGGGRSINITYTATKNVQTYQRHHNGTTLNTTFGYDTDDNLTSIEDSNNHTWKLGRDSLGRVSSMTDPTGVQVSATYDSQGNLATVTDPRLGSPIQYGYDSLHRLTGITTPTGSTTYNYDPVTQWVDSTQQKDTQGNVLQTLAYTYNNSTGQVTSTTSTLTTPGVSGSSNVTTTYGYDNYGNVDSVTPSGASPTTLNYNAAGQLLGTSETDSGPAVGPAIQASAATAGMWTTSNSQTMSWGAPESSLPITGYSYAEDASAPATVNTTSNSVAWNGIPDGQHIFTVRAVDSAGNWSPQAVFNLWVDTAPPAVSNVSVTPNPIPQGTITVTVNAGVSDAGSGLTGTPQFRWCVSSDANRNYSAYQAMSGSGSQWSLSFQETGGGQTLYYQIESQDVAGNIGVYSGSTNISGPSGDSGPLMTPTALMFLALLIFGVGAWFLNRGPGEARKSVK